MSLEGGKECCSEKFAGLSVKDLEVKGKRKGRGKCDTGLTHECGVFGCIAAGDWPSQIDVGQVICLGKL